MQRGGQLGESRRKGLEYSLVDVDPVRADARLSGVSEFGCHGGLDGSLGVRVVKDDKRGVSPELQGKSLDPVGGMTHQISSDFGRAGKVDFPDGGMLQEGLSDRR